MHSVPEIDPDSAKRRLDAGDATFVDVRDPDSYRAARIPGAVHVTDETLETFLDETDRGRAVIVYCYHGNSSVGGAAFFLEQGFKEVYSMSGGFEAWRGVYDQETS